MRLDNIYTNHTDFIKYLKSLFGYHSIYNFKKFKLFSYVTCKIYTNVKNGTHKHLSNN